MKIKHILIVGILPVFCCLFSSCWMMGPSVKGNGHVTEEVRQMKPFDKIKVSRGMNVYITQGSPAKVVVRADNNLHELIETKVQDGVLKVYCSGTVRWARELKLLVTVDHLAGVSASTGSNVYSQNTLQSDELELSATTGSNLTMDLNARSLTADCSTGSNLNLSGHAQNAELESSLGSNLKARELVTERCKMQASGGANVYATVTQHLEAEASGGANVIYYGNPASTTIDSSSGGNVNAQ